MKKPYRIIIRCNNKNTINKVVSELVKKFKGESDLKISKVHKG